MTKIDRLKYNKTIIISDKSLAKIITKNNIQRNSVELNLSKKMAFKKVKKFSKIKKSRNAKINL